MRETVINILKNIIPGTDFADSDRLIDDKILDSLSLMSLVAALSQTFDIRFKVTDLSPENFNSADKITNTVLRLKNKTK